MHHNSPYSRAAGAYGSTAAATDQRLLEGQVLLISAQKLENLSLRLRAGENVSLEEIDDTLAHNRKLWQLFLDTTMDPTHLLPQDIRNNVASLAVYVFKRTQEVLIDTVPDKFRVLIDINRNIAAGLMKKQAQAAGPQAAAPMVEKTATDSMA
ncbi:MAG: flagellar FlaF family protein [Proteobacteria bacterium]|nr:flagellar FlaF family protein [Pseudomonadota bacterium]